MKQQTKGGPYENTLQWSTLNIFILKWKEITNVFLFQMTLRFTHMCCFIIPQILSLVRHKPFFAELLTEPIFRYLGFDMFDVKDFYISQRLQ